MAKREKTEAATGNGFKPEVVEGYVSRIENMFGQIATEKGESMQRCKVLHGDIKEIYKEAKAEGIPKKALKAVVHARQLDRDRENVREDLEGEDQDNFDLLCNALGMLKDTPLGQAALKAA
jgi:uncharacterized protein (UPF0335 family)